MRFPDLSLLLTSIYVINQVLVLGLAWVKLKYLTVPVFMVPWASPDVAATTCITPRALKNADCKIPTQIYGINPDPSGTQGSVKLILMCMKSENYCLQGWTN